MNLPLRVPAALSGGWWGSPPADQLRREWLQNHEAETLRTSVAVKACLSSRKPNAQRERRRSGGVFWWGCPYSPPGEDSPKGAPSGTGSDAAMPRRAGHRLLALRNRWRWPPTRLRSTQNDCSRVGATPPPDARDERQIDGAELRGFGPRRERSARSRSQNAAPERRPPDTAEQRRTARLEHAFECTHARRQQSLYTMRPGACHASSATEGLAQADSGCSERWVTWLFGLPDNYACWLRGRTTSSSVVVLQQLGVSTEPGLSLRRPVVNGTRLSVTTD